MESSSAEEIGKHYDATTASYNLKLGFMETVTGSRRMRKALLATCKGNVLAVAIGTGKDLPLYPAHCSVTGIDISKEMLALARRRADILGRSVQLYTMDAEELEWKDQSFDTVVSTLSLCTVPHPDKALREMRRVCKNDGTILLLEHGKSSSAWVESLQRRFADRWLRKHCCHLLREPEALVRENGMNITSLRRSFFGIMRSIEATPHVQEGQPSTAAANPSSAAT